MNYYALLAEQTSSLNPFWTTFLESGAYALLGLAIFALTFVVITKISPFSIKKEIVEDQNTALAILIGSVTLGLAIILGASIAG